MKRIYVLLVVLPALWAGLGAGYGAEAGASPADELAAFAALQPIDAHAHVYKDDPAVAALLDRLNLRILNICVIDDRDPYAKGLEPQRSDVLKVARGTGGGRFSAPLSAPTTTKRRASASASYDSSTRTSRREPSR